MISRFIRQTIRSAFIVCIFAGFPQRAFAGGLEYTGAGAEALGRGGAVTARADNPMTLDYNPAGLAELRGEQSLVDINLALFNACVDPIGFYGWGAYGGGQASKLRNPKTGKDESLALGYNPANVDPAAKAKADAYYQERLDTVCARQLILPIPQFVVTKRLSERLGIGAGLIFPPAQPTAAWGGENGVITGKSGAARPSPVRYMMLQDSLVAIFPTVGVGYRIMDELRLGLALQWGMIGVTYNAMAATGGGTSPNADVIYEIHGEDYFVPSFTVSTHIVPVDALDIALAFKWQDKLDAGGDLYLTTGVFHPDMVRHTAKVKVESIRQYMPWKLRGGIRFADRLVPRPKGTGDEEADPAKKGEIHDPLNDERWDVELDVEYQFNSKNQSQRVVYPPGQAVVFENPDGKTTSLDYPQRLLDGTIPASVIEKRWKDQISARLGGTYNILRGIMGISAGAHYENRGVDPNYMQIDFWPVSRVGLHCGFVVRIKGATDLTFSYAHIFQETIVVKPPEAGDPTQGGFDKSVGVLVSRGTPRTVLNEPPVSNPDGTASLKQILTATDPASPAWIINSGTYRSYYNIVAVGINSHF